MAPRVQPGQLRLDGRRHPFGEAAVVGDQDRLRPLVVLGLREQVGGDPVRVDHRLGDDHDLGGARDHVDADPAEHLPLGLGDVGVAGADDLVDRGDGGGAVGQRRHGLRAADPVDLVDAGDRGGGEHQRVDGPVGRRDHHDDAADAGDAGRDRVHQHRAGIGRRAARDVEPDRVERAPAQAQPHAGLVDPGHVLGQLALVEGADARGGELQRRQGRGIAVRRAAAIRSGRAAAPRRSAPGGRSGGCARAAPRRRRGARRR